MTADFAFGLLMGHMAGDYLLQNEWMQLNKSRIAGALPALVHAAIYTMAVMACTWTWTWPWAAVVFLSHWPVDRWSLAERWLKLIRGRTLTGFFERGHLDIPGDGRRPMSVKHETRRENYWVLRGGFHALVYAAADNTIHLLLMWGGWHLINRL